MLILIFILIRFRKVVSLETAPPPPHWHPRNLLANLTLPISRKTLNARGASYTITSTVGIDDHEDEGGGRGGLSVNLRAQALRVEIIKLSKSHKQHGEGKEAKKEKRPPQICRTCGV